MAASFCHSLLRAMFPLRFLLRLAVLCQTTLAVASPDSPQHTRPPNPDSHPDSPRSPSGRQSGACERRKEIGEWVWVEGVNMGLGEETQPGHPDARSPPARCRPACAPARTYACFSRARASANTRPNLPPAATCPNSRERPMRPPVRVRLIPPAAAGRASRSA